jgi:hypothetical protein
MVTVAPVVLFGLLTWFVVRERLVLFVPGLILFLFGFVLAATGFGHLLGEMLTQIWGGGGHTGPVPTVPVSPSGSGVWR